LGHTVGRYYTHICGDRLIEYLAAHEHAFQGEGMWELIHAVEAIDSEDVRRLLRTLASRDGTAVRMPRPKRWSRKSSGSAWSRFGPRTRYRRFNPRTSS
jgi:hypothetical protein